VRCERPGRAWGIRIARLERDAERRCDVPCADSAGAKQGGSHAREIYDGGFDADPAGPTVKDQIDFVTQVVAHVFCAGRADAAELVSGWGRDTSAELAQHFEGDWVIGYAEADRVLAAGESITHARRAP